MRMGAHSKVTAWRARAVLVALAVLAAVAVPGAAGRADAVDLPLTTITVNGNGGDRVYDGVGAVLGGGGNARYLMDYPQQQRSQILDDLFTPGVGASLQLLKLEIGGDGNSTDGAEPSIEHTRGHINCQAGYELSIAAKAVARNRFLRLYGLQWGAPGWVGSTFSANDITYLLDWLGCAKQYGLTISYLGGWNEGDDGSHAAWFKSLRTALDSHGYSGVQIVAGDAQAGAWQYASSPDVAIMGTHNPCGFPTGADGAQTKCTVTTAALDSGKPLWASELGGMDSGAQTGCSVPCAPGTDRAMVRGYVDGRISGYLVWPAIEAMPAGLPHEDRGLGLIAADQPWSGHYKVNAMTWVLAHFTQFVWPPTDTNPGGWKYVDSASGFLQGGRANGAYDTLVRSGGTDYTTIIETTAGVSSAQQVKVKVTGGVAGLAGKTVHVWASDFDFDTDSPATWFVQQPDIQPTNGTFTLTVQPGRVYSLTTTSGQGKESNTPPPAAPLALPYRDDLATSGQAGTADDEPQYLAAQDGAFELAPCAQPDSAATTCTTQQAVGRPVLWSGPTSPNRYPFAILGDAGWNDYTVACDVLLTQAGTSAGVVGRFGGLAHAAQAGAFDGYLFDVATTGAWRLIRNTTTNPGGEVTIAAGKLSSPLGTGNWHRLALSMTGSSIVMRVDGNQVGAVTDATWSNGSAGIEAGAFTDQWPQAQYSHLAVTQN